ncbi:MAG: glycoside hydrolase family 5 protein [Melioribacteraceae bacterium]|nr:glycoside hydrolase family 5 protein [Melioribacteraceae bacterium]MCF8431293.1 glycoside hydrolase family 5 protein [Melioribacteraceae bacterium]
MLLLFSFLLVSTQIIPQENLVYVDDEGRMRWSSDETEAYFWGVNYTVPFAHSFRAIKAKGFDHKEVIDQDIQQFKRLCINAYRVHVWDREISDRNGNLIPNDHLELFDYLISKLIENDIYVIVTPIAWWGNGYPEPDQETKGFSSFGSKLDLSTKEDLIQSQENYLKQFLNHKNKFTEKLYKNESNIIAFEIFNEPNLPDDSVQVTNYVNRLVKSIRSTGVTKPIFFNISENPEINTWSGVANAEIDGVSFQWYPTGLVKGNTLKGNYLANVSNYVLPKYSQNIKNKAKMIYEFDAADISSSIMYPVIADSYKRAGMQWVTMFSYDPTPIAAFNTEYFTHYFNLAYAPGKAISYLIAGKLFQDKNQKGIVSGFNNVKKSNYSVSYNDNISLLNAEEYFYYSNSTKVEPNNIHQLQSIAGVGSSSIVNYSGSGSYYLDKIEEGVWKLEVFPDAVQIKDPFGSNNLESPVTQLMWTENTISIKLPDLGADYFISSPLNKNTASQKAEGFTTTIRPGSYILSREKFVKNKDLSYFDFEGLKKLTESKYFLDVINVSPHKIETGNPANLEFNILSDSHITDAKIFYRRIGWRGFGSVELEKSNDYNFMAGLPENVLNNGRLEYFLSFQLDGKTKTFPGNYSLAPDNWGFNGEKGFILDVFPWSNKVNLFDPESDLENLIIPNVWASLRFTNELIFNENGDLSASIILGEYKKELPEFSFQIFAGDKLEDAEEIEKYEMDFTLTSNIKNKLEIRFIYDNGFGFSKTIEMSETKNTLEIYPKELTKIKYALLPRPYPKFLPYWFQLTGDTNVINSNPKLNLIQFAIPLENESVNKNINTKIEIGKISVVRKKD